MITDYIDIRVFIISFAIGIFFVYISGTDLREVYVYPTLDNYNDILYQDNTGTCFQMIPEEVSCNGEEFMLLMQM